jgi:ribosomal protein L22
VVENRLDPTKLLIGQILIDFAIVLFGIWFVTKGRYRSGRS